MRRAIVYLSLKMGNWIVTNGLQLVFEVFGQASRPQADLHARNNK
jgi:hypothetical protein